MTFRRNLDHDEFGNSVEERTGKLCQRVEWRHTIDEDEEEDRDPVRHDSDRDSEQFISDQKQG
jgi:hypothetical protein